MFREDEHPRDKSGKFTDKGAGEGEKLRKAVRIYSDEPEKDAPPQKVPNLQQGLTVWKQSTISGTLRKWGSKIQRSMKRRRSSSSIVTKVNCITAMQEGDFIFMMKRQRNLYPRAVAWFILLTLYQKVNLKEKWDRIN